MDGLRRVKAIVLLAALGLLVGCATYRLRHASVEGKKIEYSASGKGTPVVVYLSGLGNTMDTWREVYWRTRGMTTSVMYNRLGYGGSSRANGPRTGQQVVEELRGFLRAAGYPPPYVVVAHSVAGLYAVLYAKSYPQEVCGMVLVDASHWDQKDYLARQSKGVLSSVMDFLGKVQGFLVNAGAAEEEFEGVDSTCAAIRQGAAFPDIPLVVITAGHHLPVPGAIPEDQWRRWQSDLVALSPKGRQVIAQRSDHFVQTREPGLVADAVKDVLKQARPAPKPEKSP